MCRELPTTTGANRLTVRRRIVLRTWMRGPMGPVILARLGRHRWSEPLAKTSITAGYEGPSCSLSLHSSVNRSQAGEELPVSEDRRAMATAVSSCSDFGVGWT
jgi:hypothetical protein